MRSLSLIGADQLRRAGLNVDLQEMEFGAIVKRRTSQSPPDKGGWNVFFTLTDRSIPNIHPFGIPALRADGKAAYDGWPDSPRIEELRRDWLDAGEFGRCYDDNRLAAIAGLGQLLFGRGRVVSPPAGWRSRHKDQISSERMPVRPLGSRADPPRRPS